VAPSNPEIILRRLNKQLGVRVEREHFSRERLEAAFASARCPDETDLLGQFEKSKAFVRSQY
jgi:hypothetical protein